MKLVKFIKLYSRKRKKPLTKKQIQKQKEREKKLIQEMLETEMEDSWYSIKSKEKING